MDILKDLAKEHPLATIIALVAITAIHGIVEMEKIKQQ